MTSKSQWYLASYFWLISDHSFLSSPSGLLMLSDHKGHTSASGPLCLLFSLPEMLFLRYPQDLLPHVRQNLSLNIHILKTSMTNSCWKHCIQTSHTPAPLHTPCSTFMLYFPPKHFSSVTSLICCVIIVLDSCWHSLNKTLAPCRWEILFVWFIDLPWAPRMMLII